MGRDIKYFCDLNIRQNFYSKNIIEKSLSAADVLKVNIDEIKLLNDLLFDEDFDLNKTAFGLMEKFKIDLLAVTKGAEGSVLFHNGSSDDYEMNSEKVVDTVGAGDAFASVLCIGYLHGWKLAVINKLANEFAGEICHINGALPEDDKIYNKFKGEFEHETK